MSRCRGCGCDLPEFWDSADHCQFCHMLIVRGYTWLKAEMPRLLEDTMDHDRVCLKIGDLVQHADTLKFNNDMLQKKLFCTVLELNDLKEASLRQETPFHGDGI